MYERTRTFTEHRHVQCVIDIYDFIKRKVTLFFLNIYCIDVSDATHLELDVRLLADAQVRADVGVLLVLAQEVVAADEDVAQPLEDLRVLDDLVLDQLLADAEQHLRAATTRNSTCELQTTRNSNIATTQNFSQHFILYCFVRFTTCV